MEEPEREFDQMHHVEIGASWFRNPFGTVNPEKRIRASRAGLHVDDELFVPRHHIERAFYAPREGARGRVIVVASGFPRIAVEMLTRHEARRLLAALAFDASNKQLTFTSESLLRSNPATSVWAIFLAIFLGVSNDTATWGDVFIGSFAFHASVFVLVAWFLYWFLTPSVVVGSDGIAVRGAAIGRRKFISYDEIDHVRHAIVPRRRQAGEFEHFLVVDRKRGDDIRVRVKRGERNEDDAAGLVERIEEAIEARTSHEIPVTVESMLARGERSAHDWIDALRRIRASEEVHYRVAAVDQESLFSAVEDATKKPETRIAAAIALGPELDEGERARLRVSAEAVAEPKLRVALEHVAEGADTEALAKILDDLDATPSAEG